MNKPTPRTKIAYDYNECSAYLEDKYHYDERDYAGRRGPPRNNSKPYWNFWHFLIAQIGDMHNGSYFTMHDEMKDGAEPWQCEILERYLSEFGVEKDGQRFIEFWVEW